MPHGVIMFPPRAVDYLAKTVVTEVRNLLSCWSRNNKASKTIALLLPEV